MRKLKWLGAISATGLAVFCVACGDSDEPNDTNAPSGTTTDVSPTGPTSVAPSPTTAQPPSNPGEPVSPSNGPTPSPVTPAVAPSTPDGMTAQPPSPDVEPTAPLVQPPAPTVGPTASPVDPVTPTVAPTNPDVAPPVAPQEPTLEPIPEPTLITSGENNYWQIGEPTMGAGNPNVTVNADQEEQDWHGFGGTFNEAGWEALSHVSAADRDRALHLLFDVADGAAFTKGRIPIGSSDYGLNRYSLNDSQTPDPEMNNFSIERDRMHLIPYIKAALALRPDLEMWGSPWSPPPWMKDNNAYDRGNMRTEYLGAHALYLAKFVEEYAAEGIEVSAVQPQNEPGYLQDYPSCGWTPTQMTDYIRDHLGPLFAGRLPNTEIWLGTLSNAQSDHGIGQAVVSNAGAKAFLSGVGLQWAMRQNTGYYVQQGLTVMQTEHQCGNFPPTPRSQQYENSPAPNDHAYALESWGLIYDWINRGVNSYLAWNMVLNTFGTNLDMVRPWNQNALLAVDEASGELIVTPTYWVFRHLSQYIEPGAKRVATQGGQALSFKNTDGSIVTVLHNNGGAAAQTTLAVGGEMLQFEVPARGWATVNWQP